MPETLNDWLDALANLAVIFGTYLMYKQSKKDNKKPVPPKRRKRKRR